MPPKNKIHMTSFYEFASRLELVQQSLGLEQQHNLVNGCAHANLGQVNGQVGLTLGRSLVRVVDTGKVLDLTTTRGGVDASAVSLFALFERCGDVDEIKGAVLFDELAGVLSARLEGCNGGGNDGGTGLGQFAGNKANASDVGVAVLLVEAELGAQLVADSLAQEERNGAATLLVEGDVEGTGNGVLAAVGVAGQEDTETLLVAGRVRLAQDADNLGVREPLGNVTTGAQATAELSSRNVEGSDVLGDLVSGAVLVRVGQVRHLQKGNDLDTELVSVLFDKVLGIVGAVKVFALAVLTGTGVVTTDDKVGGTVVLADNGVPQGLAGTSHAHGQGQEGENGHSVGVAGEESLVDADAGKVVNVSGLGETDDGVDEDVGLARAGGAHSQLTVSAVHGVSGLESDDSGPAEFVKVEADLCRGVLECVSYCSAWPKIIP